MPKRGRTDATWGNSLWAGHIVPNARRDLFKLLFLPLFFVVLSDLYAQRQDISIRTLSSDVATSVASDHCILQDREGFLWFGTYSGLYRYDGYSLKAYTHDPANRYSISSDVINAVFEDTSGVLWIGTKQAGLNKFDRKTESFTHFVHDPADSSSLANNSIHTICESREGTLLLALLGGVDEFDKVKRVFKHYRHFFEDANLGRQDDASTIYEDHLGTIWVGTWGGGMNEIDKRGQGFRKYHHDPHDPGSLSDDQVHTIYETKDGTLWVGTWQGGLNRFDRGSRSFASFTYKPSVTNSLSNNSVSTIVETTDGLLWIGTWGGGLNLFDRKTSKFVNYTFDPSRKNSLCDNKVTSLYEDKTGILWVGTWSGINYVDLMRPQFTNHAADLIRSPGTIKYDARSILRDGSADLWVGTWGGGLHRFNFQHMRKTEYRHSPLNPSSLSNDEIYSIYKDKSGTLWIGTSDQLNRFDEKRNLFTRFRHDPLDSNSLGSNLVTSILEDGVGTLWIGTYFGGLDEFDRARGHIRHHRHSSNDPYTLSEDHVSTIFEDSRGTIWIGTLSGGLNRYNRELDRFERFTHEPGTASSLTSNEIISIYEDKAGGFWVRTQEGLDKLDRVRAVFEHCTHDDGIPASMSGSIREDNKGNLWFSTSQGVAKVNRVTHLERIYAPSEGFQAVPFDSLNAGEMSRSDRFYLGGHPGLVSFVPDSIKGNSFVPPIVVTSVRRNREELMPGADPGHDREFELSYDDRVISFEFSALNFRNPEKNQYAYLLEGIDKDWNYCGTRRFVTYTNLDGGKYIFRVKGSNDEEIWNESGTSVTLVIKPPFWKTWWFRTFAFVAVFCSVGGAIRYIEIRKMKRRIELLEQERALERERTRISQDMHDEVGASLTEIAILSELARKEMGDTPDMAGSHIRKIADRSREVVDSISEIIWTINPKNDHLDDLVAYLHHYAGQFLKSTSIQCRFESPETVPEFSLSAEVRRHIFLVFKEALHNVVKHSNATETTVRCGLGRGGMEISVEDNGQGFPVEEISPFGNGVLSMRRRIESIGGVFVIDSHQGGGTKVSISVPIVVCRS